MKLLTHVYSEYDPKDLQSMEGRTFTVNCMGEVGDWLFIRHMDYTATYGHNLAEVEIYEPGKALRPGFS